MWKKILFILSLLIISFLVFFFWIIFKSVQTSPEIIITPPSQRPHEITPNENLNNTQNSAMPPEEKEHFSQGRAYHVTQEDCKNKCTSFQKETDGWTYCANICGIIPLESETLDCTQGTGLTRDYCLRNVAIDTADADLCGDISDRAIAKQCRDRVAEKIIDEQF